MIFDGHGDVWTDVTCRAVDHGERDIFRKHHQNYAEIGIVQTIPKLKLCRNFPSNIENIIGFT